MLLNKRLVTYVGKTQWIMHLLL